MSNPKKDTKKTTSELKKVAGGATPADYQSAGGGQSTMPPAFDINVQRHYPQQVGLEIANVSAGNTPGAGKIDDSEPSLPQYAPKSIKTGTGMSDTDLSNASAGATPATIGSSFGGVEPQFPETQPKAPSSIQGGLSYNELNNASAGATGPGADYGSIGNPPIEKPKLSVGGTVAPVQTDNAGNV